MNELSVVVFIAVVVGILFLFRAFGAWMFRIDEVIKESKETNRLLRISIQETRGKDGL